ncbi:12787_t:CDS:2 [Entrophospora sp. SA101]|nr:12787_t:CDS:2 [Entrophospora sp. SA101]CAJ0901696.1 2950_t:CDS:2 [Entrophospora sp. SA101]
MNLIELPREICIEIITKYGLNISDIMNLLMTCHNLASLTVPLLWKERKFTEKNSLSKFINKLVIEELEFESRICIDIGLIEFIAEKCVNLKEVSLGLSNKQRKKYELPLHLLDDDDGLCGAMKCGKINSIRLVAYNSKESLLSVRIISTDQLLLESNIKDPSIIVEYFGKYCKNLRNFDFATERLPINESAVNTLSTGCPKLNALDIPAHGRSILILPRFKSLTSVHLSYELKGEDLDFLSRNDEENDNEMISLKDLSIECIKSRSNFEFLKLFPNLESLEIGTFDELDELVLKNIVKSKKVIKLKLFKTPKITDKCLLLIASMSQLEKFSIENRLNEVSKQGWINLVVRPPGVCSWKELLIYDSREIGPEFFEILERDHHGLKSLTIRNDKKNLLENNKRVFDGKFKESWEACKKNSSLFRWPKSERKKKDFKMGDFKDVY